MNKILKVGILSTLMLTFLVSIAGYFEFIFSCHVKVIIFNLNSMILVLGFGLSITFLFVGKKGNIWFYIPIMIIIFGEIVVSGIWSYINPIQITNPGMQFNIGSLGIDFIDILFGNLSGSIVTVLTGPTILIPYVMLSIATSKLSFMLGVIAFYGFKGVILWLGAFHIYPEFYAIFSACLAGIRVALKSFESFLQIRKKGFKSSVEEIKNAMVHELRNTMPKVIILLVIAALLETLWTPFWINYWLHHIL